MLGILVIDSLIFCLTRDRRCVDTSARISGVLSSFWCFDWGFVFFLAACAVGNLLLYSDS
jgi:hypothetical protein